MLTTLGRELFDEWRSLSEEKRRLKILEEIANASSIEERFAILVVLLYPENYGRYKAIQEDTNVAAVYWNHVALKRQRITSQMIQAFGKKWPQYAYWMITGLDGKDIESQHPTSLIDAYMEVFQKPRVKRLF